MPEDEQAMKLFQARKESLVESEIRNSELFKKLQITMSNFLNIKFDIADMISAYMELDQSNTNAQVGYGDFEPTVQLNLIDEVIRGTIYTISKEENGLVLDDNGTVNIEETIKSRMLSQYHFVENFDLLTVAQQRDLIDAIGADLGIEKVADVFIDKQIESDKLFSWLDNSTTELDREYFNEIFSGIMSTADIKLASDNYVIQNFEEQSVKDLNIDTRGKQFLEAGTGEISFMNRAFLANSKFSEENVSWDELKNDPYAKKHFMREDGSLDTEAIKARVDEWKETFIVEYRMNVIEQYFQAKKNGLEDFSDLPFEQKDLILGCALMLYEDKNADPQYRKIAAATLMGIDSKLLEEKKDENGNIIKGETQVSTFLTSAYNGMRPGQQQYNLGAIRKAYRQNEEAVMQAHLLGLQEKESRGELCSREEYMSNTTQRTKKDLMAFANEIEQINNPKGNLIEKDVQKRLGIKLDEVLSLLTNEKGEEISSIRKVNTVMATYLTLKESVERFGLDIGNKESNLEALKLLEEHIKQDPITYGKYISEITDENGERHREIIIDEKKALRKDYRNDGARYSQDVNAVLEVVRDMALRELAKNDSFRERMTKDGVERFAEDFKDGVKYFLKQALNRAFGEEKASKMLDSVRKNKAYQVAKKSTYSFFKAAYGLTKVIGGVATLSVLRPNDRLALPSADHKLKVKDIDTIIDNTKNSNFISTYEQLKLVSIAVCKYDSSTPEMKKMYEEEIKKMGLAQKYIDEETGEVDVSKAIEAGKKWKERFVNQKRGEGLAEYTDLRREGKGFDEFTPDQKARIFRAAIMAFSDDSTNVQLKNLAGAIIEEISPKTLSAVTTEKGENGRTTTELKLNESKVVEFYNSAFDRPKCKSIDEIISIYHDEEALITNDKISRLEKNGLKSKEEWKAINDQQREARNTRRIFGNRNNNAENLRKLSTAAKMIIPSGESQAQPDEKTTIIKDSALAPLPKEYTEKTDAIGIEAAARQKAVPSQKDQAVKVGVRDEEVK